MLPADWIANLGAIAATVGSVVTAVTAVLIYVQIQQTRKSIKSTQEMVEIARREHEIARASVIEARKARLDGSMPDTSVRLSRGAQRYFDPTALQRAKEPWEAASSGRFDIQPGTSFTVSEDGDAELGVWMEVEVRNEGDRSAELLFRQVFRPTRAKPEFEHRRLLPGEETVILFVSILRVADWVRLAKVHLEKKTGSAGESIVRLGSVGVFGSADAGADDMSEVAHVGSLLVREYNNPDSWVVADGKDHPGAYPELRYNVFAAKRSYHESLEGKRWIETDDDWVV